MPAGHETPPGPNVGTPRDHGVEEWAFQAVGVVARRRAGFVTLPARMHDVQTLRRFDEPSTTALTRWMLGFQRRFVRRCEWLRLMPNDGCFPQTSQTAAIARTTPQEELRDGSKG